MGFRSMTLNSSQISFACINNISNMKDFAYCFVDLAKTFSCFDETRVYTNHCHKRAKTEKYKSETSSNFYKTSKRVDKLATSGNSVNNTLDHEVSSTKQNSMWTSSVSGNLNDSSS